MILPSTKECSGPPLPARSRTHRNHVVVPSFYPRTARRACAQMRREVAASRTRATFHGSRARSRMHCMGKLLDRAIEEAHKLAENEQEAIGAWLLAEIESEREWDELFSRPPSEALERMAAEALEDFRLGRTSPLDPDRL